MIRTFCAACAIHSHTGAVAAATRYCGRSARSCTERRRPQQALQENKEGGAEQYYADKKCAEAVAVAVEACVTTSAARRVIHEAVHWQGKGGPVRGGSFRDDGHRARVVLGGAGEGFGRGGRGENLGQGEMRGLVAHVPPVRAHGVVRCALGWACCQRTWVGRRGLGSAMPCVLGNGLYMQNITRTSAVKEASCL